MLCVPLCANYCVRYLQAPSMSSKGGFAEELEDENMDPSKMMFDWGPGGFGEGYTQEQVDGKCFSRPASPLK